MAKILVIDASHRNRTQIEKILRLRTEHAVILAQDGAEAFDRLASSLPDMILLDLFLPRVDGFHLIKVLKEHAATSKIPLLLLVSGSLDPVTEARVRQLPVAGRIEMPASSSELIEAISLILIRRREVPAIRQEPIDGAAREISRVVWPTVPKPPPPPAPEATQEAPRVVTPVAWPRAGSREDRIRSASGDRGADPPREAAPKKVTGREFRAKLALQASGQKDPALDPGPEGPPRHPAKGDSRDRRRQGERPGRPETAGRPEPDTRGARSGRPRSAQGPSNEPPPPVDPERVAALLKLAGKSPAARPSSAGFQPIPFAPADQARVLDFTRGKGGGEETRKSEIPGHTNRTEKTTEPAVKKPAPSARDPRKGDPRPPAVRPVAWTQIRKGDGGPDSAKP